MSHDPLSISPTRIVRPVESSVDITTDSRIILCRVAMSGRSSRIGPVLLVDFGREVFGKVRLDVISVGDGGMARLRIRLGESVSEAESENDCFIERIEWAISGVRLEIGPSGFRFLRLDLLDTDHGVALAIPKALLIQRNLQTTGAFSCSDDRLDQIWAVGARTVHLCMQDAIWDGIKRGRTVWAGDLHPAMNVIAAAFGPHPVVFESLDRLMAQSTRRSGPPEWMNQIPAYSLWWVIALAEWSHYVGNRADLLARRDDLASLMAAVCDGIDADGREQFEGWRYFDWATTHDPDAIHVGYQGLSAWALRSARSLFGELKDPAMAARCGDALARIASYRPQPTSNKQANALMVLGGLADPEATNRDILAPDPSRGLTPFLGYHVLEARALASDHAGAIALIRDYWGAMLDLGATTFWEDFRDSWTIGAGRIDEPVPEGLRDIHGLSSQGFCLSLCHAWSAGPTAWLSRHVLGVQPVEAGCRAIRVCPSLGDLEWAEGRFPTPLGVVEVRHRKRPDGTIESDVVAPEGVEIRSEG